jgi:formate-dependent nitrite reductase membrane component NrfD
VNALAPALLVMEAIVALLVVPAVARGHSHVAIRIALAAVVAVCLLLTAPLARRRVGRAIGTLLQPVFLACGFLAWPMWVLGVLFIGLWIAALRTRRTLSQQQH